MLQIHEFTRVEALAREGKSDLGDKRRTKRHQQMLVSLGANPDYSFPQVFTDNAQLEAGYRLLRRGLAGDEILRVFDGDGVGVERRRLRSKQ